MSGSQRVRVLAAGCFDLLHYGHLRYLEEAKKLGGDNAELIVVVARDSTIALKKGRPPLMKEDYRRALVEALKPVDRAILGETDMDIDGVIREVNPDIIALGYDQGELADLLRGHTKAEVIMLKKYEEMSSSVIRSLIYCKWNPTSREVPSAGQDHRH